MIGRRPLVALAAGSLAALPHGSRAQAPAWPRTAAIRPGTRSLPERILTAGTTALRAQPAAQAPQVTPMPPLTPLHVYDRRPAPDQSPWLLVGRRAREDAMGWMPEAEAFPWPHPLTARLQPWPGRTRLVLFRDQAGLDEALAKPDPEAGATALEQQAAAAPLAPAGFPLTAYETPDTLRRAWADYLLPVLSATAGTAPRPHRRLELAALAAAGPVPPRPNRLGIAVVVDTSASMDPYIEKVRTAITALVRAAPDRSGGTVRFALIGFRNSLAVQPRLEYLTRIFAGFADSADPDLLARRMAEMRAATADSLSFEEDSFAGLQAALTRLDWSGLDGRAVVLVTDAGSRTADDPHSATGFTEEQMANLAKERRTAILALHLRTQAGRANHAAAQRQYEAVTRGAAPNDRAQYYSVAEGRLGELDAQMGRLLDSLIELVRDPQLPPPPNPPPRPVIPLPDILPLTWVRRAGQPSALPEVVRGWAADGWRGEEPGEVAGLHLLLNRIQLGRLASAAEALAQHGRHYAPHPAGLFPFLAQERLLPGDPATARLGEVFGEEIEGLPYASEVAGLDQRGWLAHANRLELLDRLEDKARHYRRYLAATRGWHMLAGIEETWPVPLEALP